MMQPSNKPFVFTTHMNTKTQHIILIGLFLIMPLFAIKAQDYEHAVKAKGLSPLGISYKFLNGFERGYEIMLMKHNHGYSLNGLRIYHTPVIPRKSSKWFFCYGYGAHVSIYNQYSIYNPFRPFDPPRNPSRPFVSVGMDGYAGVEYRFLKHPFILSFDCIPNFEMFGPDFFRVTFDNTSFGFSYIF